MTSTDDHLPVADPVALTARAAIYRHEPDPGGHGERFTVAVTSRLAVTIDPRAVRIGDFPVASDDRELTIEWTDEDIHQQRIAVIPLGPGMIRALRGALDAAERDATERGGQAVPGTPGSYVDAAADLL